MILIGSSDPGAIKYFQSFYSELDMPVVFTSSLESSIFFKKNNISVLKEWKKLKNVKLVITGSSLGDTIDKELIAWSKKNRIYCISVIEHWTNFNKRFYFKNKKIYPDTIFVNDDLAHSMSIKEGIKRELLFISGNPLLEKISNKYNKEPIFKNKSKSGKKILFLSEPISEQFLDKKRPLKEKKILKSIIDVLPKDHQLTIKLHPRENEKKYKDCLKSLTNTKVLKNLDTKTIASDFDFIIGISTFLLFELSYLRDDLISFNLGKNNFLGEKLGISKNLKSKRSLKKILSGNENINNSTLKFKKKFKGSKKKIINFIEKIYRINDDIQ